MEELEDSVWGVVRQENEREDQVEAVRNSAKTSTDVRGRDMGVEKGTGKEIEVAEMIMQRWMCGVTKLDKIRNERIRGTTKVGGKSQRKYRREG